MGNKFDYLKIQSVKQLQNDYDRVIDLAQAILSEIDVRQARRERKQIGEALHGDN